MNKRLKPCAGTCATRHSLAYTFFVSRVSSSAQSAAPGWPADCYKWQWQWNLLVIALVQTRGLGVRSDWCLPRLGELA